MAEAVTHGFFVRFFPPYSVAIYFGGNHAVIRHVDFVIFHGVGTGVPGRAFMSFSGMDGRVRPWRLNMRHYRLGRRTLRDGSAANVAPGP